MMDIASARGANRGVDPAALAQEAANILAGGDRDGALKLVERGLAIRPSFPPLLSLKAVVLAELGRAASAVGMARAASAAAPAWPDGLANLGFVLQAAGLPDEAEKAYRTALAKAPRHLVAQMNLANLLMHNGRSDEAIALFRRALKADPNHLQVRFNLSLALKQTGDSEAALAGFQSLFEAAPKQQVEAGNHAAALLLDRYEAAAALAILDRAIAAAPGHARSHNNRGTALRMLCQPADALAAYRQAATLAPQVGDTWRNIGLLAADLGLLDEAAEALRTALARSPDDAIARHTLDAVEGRTTAAPPGDYVSRSFDTFAPTFDRQLIGELGYRVPAALAALAARLAPSRGFARALDLGCGTGLVAEAFRDLAADWAPKDWTGVDLSAGMLEICDGKQLYRRLAQADVTRFLADCGETFDLITAGDLVIYLGDLTPLFAALAGTLAEGGMALLSTERTSDGEGDCKLRSSGRYAHGDAAVERAATAAGLTLLAREDGVARQEQGQPVAGTLFAFARQASKISLSID